MGILFSFTQNLLNAFASDDEPFAIELTEEQDEEEKRESEENRENRENKEKSETEIDDFFSHDFHCSLSLFYVNVNLSDYSIGNYSNDIYDLSTPPPKFS